MPQVLILMGSDSDAPVMQAAVDALNEFGISSEMTVASAHRSPARVMRLVEDAPGRGVKLFIVGAGAAAHLGGVVAAHSILPVIGVPIDSSALKGLDALLSARRGAQNHLALYCDHWSEKERQIVLQALLIMRDRFSSPTPSETEQ